MRSTANTASVLFIAFGVAVAIAQPGLGGPQWSLDAALSETNAVGVVLDRRDGHIMAVVREADAGRMASAPGSTLKPLFLAAALHDGRVHPETTVVCRGDLRIAGRDLACTHPRERNVFDAEQALAYSCNTWFANLARRFSPEEATAVLRTAGLGSRTGLLHDESAGFLNKPAGEANVQLLVLGIDGVTTTPLQLATAYLRLARRLDAEPLVRRGLEGSVTYGMAHNAATAGITIAGKTGTASNPGEAWTHGWFAGIASRGAKQIVLVIYLPHGNGSDAAALAHRFFVLWGRTQ
jgi:cell division protein FtsI/penicillin-binding protein 2